MPPKAKFSGVDFSLVGPEQLGPTDEPGAGFRPKKREFAQYWRGDLIRREMACAICQAWILRTDEGLAAYITMYADKLDTDVKLLNEEGVDRTTFPAVKIGLLAADERAKGAGKTLVVWAMQHIIETIRPELGVRFVTVDAHIDHDTGYDTAPYYRKFGFRLIDQSDKGPKGYRAMYLDLNAVEAEL
jgi:hypothetical protein